MEEIRHVCRGKVKDSLESEQSHFVLNTGCYWEPVELLQDRWAMAGGCDSGDDLRCPIMNKLEFWLILRRVFRGENIKTRKLHMIQRHG